ncbi:serine/threonine protein kinase [Streptomyces sp. bgisy154]|uniref:serine/threonine protein kinase n=1 Tax=Streptomyces sp. bgisy154 TaxID=3413794 RepID=UPI003D7240BB
MAMVKARVATSGLVAGRYRLLDVVHRETNRVTWYAEDVPKTRPCVVTRVGLPDGMGEEDVRRAADRVLRMSETMARLCPGRIAAALDAVAQDGALWTVTEWIDGRPLGQLLAQRRDFPPARAAGIGLEVLGVLEAAHGEGITHGELSPGQVFLRERGPVVLTGFGLAGAALVPRLAAPSYASPEQARDERIGPAADLWALGALLYTMVEGRPPFRDRDRPEGTLRGVDRLPLRPPLRAGPLTAIVQGLLRKDSRERPNRAVVRQALARAVEEDSREGARTVPLRAYPLLRWAVPRGSGRVMLATGTALAVLTVAVAAVAVTQRMSGTDGGPSEAAAHTRPTESGTPGASGATPGGSAAPGTPAAPSPSPTDSPPSSPPSASPTAPSSPPSSPAASATAPRPAGGFAPYRSPLGFSVSLPEGWRVLATDRQADLAYRVTFGKDGDPRTLAVTYSERVGPDPVAVWRDDVEPVLRREAGFRRLGAIRATTYQGSRAADMEWLTDVAGTRVRTFGRGFLLGGRRGFSLRWSTPAADWDEAANRQALDTFLTTFRPGSA